MATVTTAAPKQRSRITPGASPRAVDAGAGARDAANRTDRTSATQASPLGERLVQRLAVGVSFVLAIAMLASAATAQGVKLSGPEKGHGDIAVLQVDSVAQGPGRNTEAMFRFEDPVVPGVTCTVAASFNPQDAIRDAGAVTHVDLACGGDPDTWPLPWSVETGRSTVDLAAHATNADDGTLLTVTRSVMNGSWLVYKIGGKVAPRAVASVPVTKR